MNAIEDIDAAGTGTEDQNLRAEFLAQSYRCAPTGLNVNTVPGISDDDSLILNQEGLKEALIEGMISTLAPAHKLFVAEEAYRQALLIPLDDGRMVKPRGVGLDIRNNTELLARIREAATSPFSTLGEVRAALNALRGLENNPHLASHKRSVQLSEQSRKTYRRVLEAKEQGLKRAIVSANTQTKEDLGLAEAEQEVKDKIDAPNADTKDVYVTMTPNSENGNKMPPLINDVVRLDIALWERTVAKHKRAIQTHQAFKLAWFEWLADTMDHGEVFTGEKDEQGNKIYSPEGLLPLDAEEMWHDMASVCEEVPDINPPRFSLDTAGPGDVHGLPGRVQQSMSRTSHQALHRTDMERWILGEGIRFLLDDFGYGETGVAAFANGGTHGMDTLMQKFAEGDSRLVIVVNKKDEFAKILREEASWRREREIMLEKIGAKAVLEELGKRIDIPAELTTDTFVGDAVPHDVPQVIELEENETLQPGTPNFAKLQKALKTADTVVCLGNVTTKGNRHLDGLMQSKKEAIETIDHPITYIVDGVSLEMGGVFEDIVDDQIVGQGLDPATISSQQRKTFEETTRAIMPDILVIAGQKGLAQNGGGWFGALIGKNALALENKAVRRMTEDPSLKGKGCPYSKWFNYHGDVMAMDGQTPETPSNMTALTLVMTKRAFGQFNGALYQSIREERRRAQTFMLGEGRMLLEDAGVNFIVENPKKNSSRTTYVFRVPPDISADELVKLVGKRYGCVISKGYKDTDQDTGDRIIRLCMYSAGVHQSLIADVRAIHHVLKNPMMRRLVLKDPDARAQALAEIQNLQTAG
jgi:aspartate aminotransferase-like enzyme